MKQFNRLDLKLKTRGRHGKGRGRFWSLTSKTPSNNLAQFNLKEENPLFDKKKLIYPPFFLDWSNFNLMKLEEVLFQIQWKLVTKLANLSRLAFF